MSTVTTFDSTKEFLRDILRELATGEAQLPEFQRGWVWDDEHIRSLVASVGSAYPIGAVMMLETGGTTNFASRPVEGVSFAEETRPQPKRLILDGQQRLTSLFQVTLLGRVVETQNARKERIKRWYYVDMRKALGPGSDLEDAIVGVPESRQLVNFRGEVQLDLSTTEQECEKCLFPLSLIFEPKKWRQAYNKHWHYAQEMMELFDEFETHVLEVFHTYQVPVIVLRRDTPKAAVCQVFEKVNTGGVSLNAFELLTATYAADGFSLRDDWHGPRTHPSAGQRQCIHHDPVLRGVQETDYLQAVSLLYTLGLNEHHLAGGGSPDGAPGVSCKRVTILNLPLDGYRRWSGAATEGFLRAGRLLKLWNIFSARDLPYQTQLVPLAAALARLGPRWEEDGVRRRLARWYWCGVFGELYGSAIESRFAKDLPQLLSWIAGGPEPDTVREAQFHPNRLLTLRTRNSAAYKGLHAVLMRDGGLDFRTGSPITLTTYWEERIDIHHIFPKKWCIDHGVPASTYDSIVNKTAISARTNRIIGGQAPSRYLKALQHEAEIDVERMGEVLRTHAIRPELLRSDDFESFFAARREALLERIGNAMGKPLTSGSAIVEPVEVVDDPLEVEEDIAYLPDESAQFTAL